MTKAHALGLVAAAAVLAVLAGRALLWAIHHDVIDEVSRRERMRPDAEIARWIEARKAERAGR